jgi:hypothetical protein
VSTFCSTSAIHSFPRAGEFGSGVAPAAGDKMNAGLALLNTGSPLNDGAVDAVCGEAANEGELNLVVKSIVVVEATGVVKSALRLKASQFNC